MEANILIFRGDLLAQELEPSYLKITNNVGQSFMKKPKLFVGKNLKVKDFITEGVEMQVGNFK